MTIPPRTARALSPRSWLRILAINLAVAATVAGVMALAGRGELSTVVIALVYANVIGVGAALFLPWLTRRLGEHGGEPAWFVVPTALLGLASVGALMIGLGAVGLGLLPLGQLWVVTWPSLAIAAVTTLGLGVGIALHEQTRARHAEATLGRVRAEQFATEALLASLEARLRPHFLYNALNTIAGVIPKDTRLAHRLLCDLGAVLRLTLDRRGRRTVPLEDELEVVLAYLEIQEARFRRLDYATDVPPALRRCEIPPFALQPVVENSVVHVAQARPGRMRLRVEARAAGDTLKLQVWDDGPGFSLDAVRPGHGLDTLRQRLDALYGGAAGLAVDRCEEGTMVTIRLPLRPERRP